MNRVASMALALALLPFATYAEPSRDERDLSKRGAMFLEELRREPITFELDLPYAVTGNPRQRLDLYLPKSRKREKLPVIVFFHGGGWQVGDKSDGAGRLMPLLRTGHYAGVSAGYRLSGEATWPAQIHDAKAAIRWIRGNASRYGLDGDRIGVWGRSAGGHLALLLGASGDVPELEGGVGENDGVSSRVAAVANFFGVSELLAMIGPPSDVDRTRADAPEALLLGGPLRENPERAKAASPLTYVSPNDPPVLTVHGTEDRTVPYDQAVRLDAALREAGVPSYFVRVEGAGHGNIGTAADDRLEAFFARYLLDERVEVSTAPIQP
jgi:acetyl esterase/lipase